MNVYVHASSFFLITHIALTVEFLIAECSSAFNVSSYSLLASPVSCISASLSDESFLFCSQPYHLLHRLLFPELSFSYFVCVCGGGDLKASYCIMIQVPPRQIAVFACISGWGIQSTRK